MENWLNKRAQLSPQKTAIVYQGQRFSFAQVAQKVHQQAQLLQGLNIKNQDRVAIFGTNSLETYYNILALQQLGAIIVFLNIRLAPNELAYQIENAQVKFCLVDSTLTDSAISQVSQVHLISQQQLKEVTPKSYTPVAVDLAQVASIMYTSGTTGQPKGVLQTWGNHWSSAINTLLNFEVTSQDAWLCTVPLFHISGFSILLRSLIYGITLYLEPHFDAQKCQQLLVKEPITIFSVVPTMLKQLLEKHTQPYNSHFRIMFLGGGPIDLPTLKSCQKYQIPTIQSYGMTETCSNVAALKPEDALRKLGSAGQALFSNQLRIDPPNSVGEIQLQSPALAVGYWHNQELYQSKFTADGWYKTGDVGYLDAENFLFVKGRIDEMFISGGENIFPLEIENVYSQLPSIQDFVVTHKKDALYGAVPIAYFTSSDRNLQRQVLQNFGRQHLAHYKVPVEFRQIQQFPRTASGKIQRTALPTLKFKLL